MKESQNVIGLAGWSGSGKTTLLVKLVPQLVAQGLRVSTIKHAHHAFDVDREGKDSFRHRTAGAHEVLVSSARRFALMHELREEEEPTLATLLRRLAPVDLVLIEGFKRESHAKIEVYRSANGKPMLFPNDKAIRAIASDIALNGLPIPCLPLDDVSAIARACISLAAPMPQSEAPTWRS